MVGYDRARKQIIIINGEMVQQQQPLKKEIKAVTKRENVTQT